MSILNVNKINPVGSGSTVTIAGIASVTNNISVGNSVTASSFHGNLTGDVTGSGANLTNLPAANLTGTLPAISGANLTSLPAQATIANNADNRVITGGSGVNLNGESTLTYDNPTLEINTDSSYGCLKLDGDAGGLIEFKDDGTRKWELYGAVDFSFYDRANTKYGLILKSGGDVEVSDGNLKIATSGHGIDFSATANSSGSNTSELFDDYEEGTFTPTNSIGLTISNNTTAHYTKIGRVVHIQLDITFSGAADSSQCGIIQGLPFTSKSGCVNEGSLQFISNTANGRFNYDEDNTRIFIGASESRIDLQNINGGHFQTRAWAVGRRIRIQMHYLTS